MGGDEGNVQLQQAPLDPVLFKGVVGPGCNVGCRGDEQHLNAPGNQQLGQDTAHVVVIIVEQHDRRRQDGTAHHIIRGKHRQLMQARQGLAQRTAKAVIAPV